MLKPGDRILILTAIGEHAMTQVLFSNKVDGEYLVMLPNGSTDKIDADGIVASYTLEKDGTYTLNKGDACGCSGDHA